MESKTVPIKQKITPMLISTETTRSIHNPLKYRTKKKGHSNFNSLSCEEKIQLVNDLEDQSQKVTYLILIVNQVYHPEV